MKRDFRSLERAHPFDLLVVGGGIYGAWVAYESALRGLEVAVVERTDWAAGTSSASSKLIHGGLRYLEQYHFGLVRKSLQERRRLRRLAPHQVLPLRFVIPAYRGDRVGRLRLKAGLVLYDLLAGNDPEWPGHRSLGRQDVLAASPFLESSGLAGGFEYGDGVMDDARMTVEVIAGAMKTGAAAVNHAGAERLLLREGAVEGAVIRDAESGESLDVRARVTINCAGAWAPELLSGASRPAVRYQKGIHLVMPSLGVDHALLVMAHADGRPYFLIPWYGRTLLGTTDTLHQGEPGEVRVDAESAEYLLRDAARVMGEGDWQKEDVIGSYAGLRTLQVSSAASPGAASREWSLLTPLPGMLMPVGGKFTAARADAVQIVGRAEALLGRGPGRPGSEDHPLPGCPSGEFADWWAESVRAGVKLGLDEETAGCAARRFGSRVIVLHRLIEADPELARRVDPEVPFCRAEIVHAAREEMARTLQDILRRRMPLLLLARPDRKHLEDAAALAGEELGWSDDRRRGEVDGILRELGAGPFAATVAGPPG